MGLHLPTILGLAYQSQNITFSEWVSLVTLCLAPLVAHVVAGTPHPTLLGQGKPKWHDYMCLYSPISIIWRYVAITDRRIRALEWSPSNMAAANTIFWTSAGWDGSEEMAIRSVFYCTSLPASSHASILSWEFLKTAVVTLQGIQAIYLLIGGFARTAQLPGLALDSLFFPAALLGLCRLCAAFWLTDEFAYVSWSGIEGNDFPMTALQGASNDLYETGRREEDQSRLIPALANILSPNRFRSASYWPSMIFRVIFITPVVVFWVVCLLWLFPGPWQASNVFTMTEFLSATYGTVFFFLAIAIYTYYAVRHGCRSTALPCISARWYKILVGLTFVAAVPVVVVCALETRRTPCGIYSTAGRDRDESLCVKILPS